MSKANAELLKNLFAVLLVLATITIGTMAVMEFWR
jgi:hypothetical protein